MNKQTVLEQCIAEEIAQIQGNYWYDGLSWVSEDVLPEGERTLAYDAIFAELIRRAKELGIRDPYIHHSGNGHYVAAEGAKTT